MYDKNQPEIIRNKLLTLQTEMKNRNFKENLFLIYKEEFEEKISTILTQKESEFMNNFIMRMNLILEDLYSSEAFDNDDFILAQKETEKKVYETLYKNSYKLLVKAWNDLQTTIQQQLQQQQKKVQSNQSKNPLEGISLPIIYLKNFNKHCLLSDVPIHTCKGKFIPVFDENKNLTHVICVKCKSSYFSHCILMYCNSCSIEYYTCHMQLDKDYQPATWDRYHCSAIVNDYMRCLDCMEMLYVKTSTGWLTCLNRSCKFEADPLTIFWVCMLCKKEFTTGAKVYNPMDYRTFKIAIKNTMLNKLPARPDSVPCCKIKATSYQFFHKNECRGILYTGVLREKKITVCSKCKVMSQNEKFLWTCPVCLNRFKERNAIDEKKDALMPDYNVSKEIRSGNEANNSDKVIPQVSVSEKQIKKDSEQEQILDNKIKIVGRPQSDSLRSSISNTIEEKSNQSKFGILNPIKKVEVKLEEEIKPGGEFIRGQTRHKTVGAPSEENQVSKIRANSKQLFNVVRNTPSIEEKEKAASALKSSILKKENGDNSGNKQGKKVSINLGEASSHESPQDEKNSKKESEREVTKGYPNNQNSVAKTSETLDPNKLKTFNLQDYTIITQIGEGTFGKIYLVEDKSKNYFSLKKIIANDEFELESFEQEYELINQIQHANVLKILATTKQKLDKTTYGLYILMETGLSDWDKEIKSRMTLKKFYTEKELIDILKQIVSALVFLQRNNISHRDIKPQNILIFKNNVYKLADFGEAKKLSLMDTNKQLNTLRGTELYMSPLLFNAMRTNQCDIKHNSYKSDVFSVAYCFIHAATLNIQTLYEFRRVYDMKTTRTLIEKYLKGKFSQNLIETLYNMLEINELNRFDFIDLEAVLNKYF